MRTSGTLYVRNLEQAALMLELDGQLSDGYWENARPMDHWQPWGFADVVVTQDGKVGRTFWAPRTNYNFTAKDLLDVVGKRMLGVVRIARRCGIDVAAALEHDVDTETGRVNWEVIGEGEWYDRKRARFARIDRAQVDAALEDEFSYTMTDMRRDLRDLKTVFQTYRSEAK